MVEFINDTWYTLESFKGGYRTKNSGKIPIGDTATGWWPKDNIEHPQNRAY